MIREILKMGDPRLLRIAEPVDHFDTHELHALVEDMFDTMRHANGAGPARRSAAVFHDPLSGVRSVWLSDRTAGRRGFHARVVQHECDHLIGKLYPMRVTDFSKFGFTEILFPGLDPKSDD